MCSTPPTSLTKYSKFWSLHFQIFVIKFNFLKEYFILWLKLDWFVDDIETASANKVLRYQPANKRPFIACRTLCGRKKPPWWRHPMETFSALLTVCSGNSPVTGEFPAHRPVTQSSDVFFDFRLNKQLSKQSWGWWFETPSRPLWRHCNDNKLNATYIPRGNVLWIWTHMDCDAGIG